MLDRALKAIIVLTLAVFAAQMVFGILRVVLGSALSAVGSAGGVVGRLLGSLLLVVLLIGLLIRLIRWVRNGGQRRSRGQGLSEWGGRSFADEVPVERRRTRPQRWPRARG